LGPNILLSTLFSNTLYVTHHRQNLILLNYSLTTRTLDRRCASTRHKGDK
jgi:hypothetical protein